MRKSHILVTTCLLLSSCVSTNSRGVSEQYQGANIIASKTVACTFEYIEEVSYEGNAIKHGLPVKQSKPLVFIFSDLNTEQPTLKGVGAANSLYESKLAKIADTADKIVLAEMTPTEKNFFVYVIYKSSGVATWTKQYQMLGTPLGTISMGKCSGQ